MGIKDSVEFSRWWMIPLCTCHSPCIDEYRPCNWFCELQTMSAVYSAITPFTAALNPNSLPILLQS